jgi:hypothetical protein
MLLALLGATGVAQAFASNLPLAWGVTAGASLLGCGYLVVRSLIPVKRYRDGDGNWNKCRTLALSTALRGQDSPPASGK